MADKDNDEAAMALASAMLNQAIVDELHTLMQVIQDIGEQEAAEQVRDVSARMLDALFDGRQDSKGDRHMEPWLMLASVAKMVSNVAHIIAHNGLHDETVTIGIMMRLASAYRKRERLSDAGQAKH